jgi:hypothetical protein
MDSFLLPELVHLVDQRQNFSQQIVCLGPLVVGEQITSLQRKTVLRARAYQQDLAVYFADLDFPRRFHSYLRFGIEGLQRYYQLEEHQSASGDDEPPLLSRQIDQASYQMAYATMAVSHSEQLQLCTTFAWNSRHPAVLFLRDQFTETVLQEIVPELIESQLAELELNPVTVNVSRESQLSNLTTQ